MKWPLVIGSPVKASGTRYPMGERTDARNVREKPPLGITPRQHGREVLGKQFPGKKRRGLVVGQQLLSREHEELVITEYLTAQARNTGDPLLITSYSVDG